MNTKPRTSTIAFLSYFALAAGCSDDAGEAGPGTGPDSAASTASVAASASGSATGSPGTTSSTDASGSRGDTESTTSEEPDSGSSEGTDSSSSSGGMPAGLPVDLGTAGDFVLLAKSGISTVPMSVITGDLGVSPAAATYITGFSLTMDASNEFSTSAQVTGQVYAANYSPPTPTTMTTAVSDMETAFIDAAGRAPDVTELGAGDISGMTLEAGVYNWGTSLSIATDVTLDGDATDVWIFQIAQDLTVDDAASVVLHGGALPKNVFWQVSGLVDLGTTAHVEGIVLTQTAITLHTGASVNGRLLAQTAVDLDASTLVEPAP